METSRATLSMNGNDESLSNEILRALPEHPSRRRRACCDIIYPTNLIYSTVIFASTVKKTVINKTYNIGLVAMVTSPGVRQTPKK